MPTQRLTPPAPPLGVTQDVVGLGYVVGDRVERRAAGSFGPGGHTGRYGRTVAPAQLRFAGAQLA